MDDREIVDLFWERSESAIAEAKDKYGRLCRAIAANITGSEQDAEECVSDACFRLWNTIPPQKPVSLKAYMLRIARFAAIDKYRYNRSRTPDGGYEAIVSELEDCVPSGDSVYSEAEKDLCAKAIDRFLESLDAEARKLFVRRYFQFESIRQLASEFGLKETAVKMRLLRTRGKLKDFLEKEGITV